MLKTIFGRAHTLKPAAAVTYTQTQFTQTEESVKEVKEVVVGVQDVEFAGAL